MNSGAGTWDISSLADLILGPTPRQTLSTPAESPSATNDVPCCADSVVSGIDDATLPSCRTALLVVTDRREGSSSVSDYAQYWSNRGQPTTTFVIGEDGLTVGCFDCNGCGEWSRAVVDAVSSGSVELLTRTLRDKVQRLVVAMSPQQDWSGDPVVRSAHSICVIVEPTQASLIRAYETLKRAAGFGGDQLLSCFVVRADSADHAMQISGRLERMGYLFLKRVVRFEGFAVEQQWNMSNRMASTFVAAEDHDKVARLLQALEQLLAQRGAQECHEQATARAIPDSILNPEPRACGPHPVVKESALPMVKVVPTPQTVQTAQQFDDLQAELIGQIYDDVVESWPVYTSPRDGCCYRWIKRRDGSRSIIVSSLHCPVGALERASAQLFPALDNDEIVLLAGKLGTEQRRAAQAIAPPVRLYEVSQMEEAQATALVLKEVTTALD